MKSHTKNLRFNHNPLNLILGTRKKQGLRIGYMEAALDGFYLNCMETGVHPEKLSKLYQISFIAQMQFHPASYSYSSSTKATEPPILLWSPIYSLPKT